MCYHSKFGRSRSNGFVDLIREIIPKKLTLRVPPCKMGRVVRNKATQLPPPPASSQYICIYSPGGTCWLFQTSATRLPCLLILKVLSESRVTWATCANFSLPRPLCSRFSPDVRDRQTYVRRQSDRQTSDKSIA